MLEMPQVQIRRVVNQLAANISEIMKFNWCFDGISTQVWENITEMLENVIRGHKLVKMKYKLIALLIISQRFPTLIWFGNYSQNVVRSVGAQILLTLVT
jgi:hypothetical protein